MESDYDIFEQMEDGSVMWIECIAGKENAIRRLGELSALLKRNRFAVHAPSGEVVARSDVRHEP